MLNVDEVEELVVLKKGVSDGTEFVVDALRYFEPV